MDQASGEHSSLTVQRLVDAFGESARPYIPLAIDITKAHAAAAGEALADVGVDIAVDTAVADTGSVVIRGKPLLCTETLARFRDEIPCFDKECINVACNMEQGTTTYMLCRTGNEEAHYYYGERARAATLCGSGPARHHGKAKHSRMALKRVTESLPKDTPEAAKAVVECYVTSVDKVPRFTVFAEHTPGLQGGLVYRVSISGVTHCDAGLLSVLVLGTGHKVVSARAIKQNCVGIIECDLVTEATGAQAASTKEPQKRRAWYKRLFG